MVNGIYTIDAHCHIYPEKIAERASEATSKFYDIKGFAGGTIKQLIDVGNPAGIDRYIVQSVATTPKQVKSINEFIADSVERMPDILTGLGTLHPDSEDIAGDIAHLMELGLKGVKLHPDIQKFKIDDYRCLKIYEICEKEGLPILMHTGDSRYDFSNPNRLVPILEIYENLTVIGAHLGGYSVWEEACEKLPKFKNLYVDCSSSLPFLKKERAVDIIRKFGADRVLFGSDYPLWSPAEEITSYLSLELTAQENELILHKNAERIFGL